MERDGDNVLGGCYFLFLSNNQPKDGVHDGGGYWGGCGTAVERVGEAFIIVWGDGISDKKNYVMALNGHQTGEKNATINKKRAHSTGGGWNMMYERWGAWGGHDSIVSMAPCEVDIKIKIN